jgi:hypothetical protein
MIIILIKNLFDVAKEIKKLDGDDWKCHILKLQNKQVMERW